MTLWMVGSALRASGRWTTTGNVAYGLLNTVCYGLVNQGWCGKLTAQLCA